MEPGVKMDKAIVLRRIDALEQMLQDLRNDVLADEPDAETVDVGRQGIWRFSDLQDLYPSIEHLLGVTALFDLTSERSPEIVTFQEVLKRSGLSEKEQGSDHSRLSWATKRTFGEKRWPVDNWQAADGEMHYRMPTLIAQWWQTIRSGKISCGYALGHKAGRAEPCPRCGG
jgi:hypothetical protein